MKLAEAAKVMAMRKGRELDAIVLGGGDGNGAEQGRRVVGNDLRQQGGGQVEGHAHDGAEGPCGFHQQAAEEQGRSVFSRAFRGL